MFAVFGLKFFYLTYNKKTCYKLKQQVFKDSGGG